MHSNISFTLLLYPSFMPLCTSLLSSFLLCFFLSIIGFICSNLLSLIFLFHSSYIVLNLTIFNVVQHLLLIFHNCLHAFELSFSSLSFSLPSSTQILRSFSATLFSFSSQVSIRRMDDEALSQRKEYDQVLH